MLESVGSMSSDDGRKQGIIHEGRAHDILIPSKHPGHLRHPWIPQRKRSLVLADDQAGMAPAPGHQNDRYAASSRVLADYNSDVLCHGAVALLPVGPIGNHGDGSTSLHRGWRLDGSHLAAACPDATDIQGGAGA
jgi:hypothetical protein